MSDADIQRILDESRTIAVVGWSPNPQRPSHWIADYLQEEGYRVFRVNPTADGAGIDVWPALDAIGEPLDLVDVFRAPPHVPEVVEAAIAAGAKAVWMQPGAEHEGAAATARAAGLTAVVGRCTYAEHRARHGGA